MRGWGYAFGVRGDAAGGRLYITLARMGGTPYGVGGDAAGGRVYITLARWGVRLRRWGGLFGGLVFEGLDDVDFVGFHWSCGGSDASVGDAVDVHDDGCGSGVDDEDHASAMDFEAGVGVEGGSAWHVLNHE